ncbi:MAG: hypothetical protein ACREAA_07995 [Candidatus Polarisedimenticolia bacterium]
MRRISGALMVMTCMAALASGPSAATETASTPAEMVAAYESLADTILGAKHTEKNLVRSILAATYRHAEAMMNDAKARLQAGQPAKTEIESVASLVSQLASEGDASVAAVRKRLLEGGHHHNAEGEKQGIFDEGFVVVTKAAKKAFLDASTAIGKLASSKDAAALQAAWQPVSQQYANLMKGAS